MGRLVKLDLVWNQTFLGIHLKNPKQGVLNCEELSLEPNQRFYQIKINP
jgi:hypothetical protein